MTESISPRPKSSRAPRRPNFRSILKAAKEIGAKSVDLGGVVVHLTDAPPTAPNGAAAEDIKSLL